MYIYCYIDSVIVSVIHTENKTGREKGGVEREGRERERKRERHTQSERGQRGREIEE